MNVCTLPEMAETLAETKPVIRDAAPVPARVDRQPEVELALGGRLYSLDLLRQAVRKIEIEERAVRQFHADEPADQIGGIGFRHPPRHHPAAILVMLVGLAEGKRANEIGRAPCRDRVCSYV